MTAILGFHPFHEENPSFFRNILGDILSDIEIPYIVEHVHIGPSEFDQRVVFHLADLVIYIARLFRRPVIGSQDLLELIEIRLPIDLL